jgi:hypothetical protein
MYVEEGEVDEKRYSNKSDGASGEVSPEVLLPKVMSTHAKKQMLHLPWYDLPSCGPTRPKGRPQPQCQRQTQSKYR